MSKGATKLIFFSMMLLSACDGYQESPTTKAAIVELNQEIAASRIKREGWVTSPEDIARHLFPAVSHDSGPQRYEVTKTATSDGTCSVTVLEEGPIDDEVLGERRTIEFQKTTGKWDITSYRYAAKRRD